MERLSIEELLLRHDPLNRCWGIIGIHEPTDNRILRPMSSSQSSSNNAHNNGNDIDIDNAQPNKSCVIIMGIGGKPAQLINIPTAKQDGVLILKRFSGGGTVVVDHSSLWTTFIGRNDTILVDSIEIKPFPREIMKWSANVIFGRAFDSWNGEIIMNDEEEEETSSGSGGNRRKKKKGKQTLVFQGKSCGLSGGFGESLILPDDIDEDDITTEQQQQLSTQQLPSFQLKENDYVLGEKKIGGNAQSIVSSGFLHHTSFLWDYDDDNMNYLTLPNKQPEYRGNRSHDEFLVRLKDHYGSSAGSGGSTSSMNKHSLFKHVKSATAQSFELEEMTLKDVLQIANDKFGGLQQWVDTKCRTKVVKL